MSKRHSAVAAYDPRFVEWFSRGARTPTTVTVPDKGTAFSMRNILYNLRVAMRREEHPQTPLANRCQVILSATGAGEAGTWTVTVRPADHHLTQYLDDAGITLPDPLPDYDEDEPGAPDRAEPYHWSPQDEWRGAPWDRTLDDDNLELEPDTDD